MKKLIIILLFIITSGIFSKTNDVFLHEFGISDKSIEYYNKALNIKSMNGENSEIRSAYRDAVKEDGRNYLALDELGNIARMEGNIQEAGNYYLKSIEVNPDGYDSYNYLIDLYRSEGNKEKMRMYAEILVEKHPDYPDGYYILAQIYEEEENEDYALKYYSDALKNYNNYNTEKFPDRAEVILENRRLDSIIGIADIYTVKAEYVKALEKLLLINPLSSNYSDIERQNYTNAVVESLEKLNKKNKKLAGRYLRIFQDRNVLPRDYKF